MNQSVFKSLLQENKVVERVVRRLHQEKHKFEKYLTLYEDNKLVTTFQA